MLYFSLIRVNETHLHYIIAVYHNSVVTNQCTVKNEASDTEKQCWLTRCLKSLITSYQMWYKAFREPAIFMLELQILNFLMYKGKSWCLQEQDCCTCVTCSYQNVSGTVLTSAHDNLYFPNSQPTLLKVWYTIWKWVGKLFNLLQVIFWLLFTHIFVMNTITTYIV
jgi:hypothetical protein